MGYLPGFVSTTVYIKPEIKRMLELLAKQRSRPVYELYDEALALYVSTTTTPNQRVALKKALDVMELPAAAQKVVDAAKKVAAKVARPLPVASKKALPAAAKKVAKAR